MKIRQDCVPGRAGCIMRELLSPKDDYQPPATMGPHPEPDEEGPDQA